MHKLTKAVFPVAGIGSRFLPATKASPKEMMPIVDKPLIQYAVEEAVEAGITDMIFITGRNKRTIEDHFDKAYEVESELAAQGKTELLEMVRSVIPPGINCIYIRQAEALGLGHAVLCARPVMKIMSVMPAAAASSTAYWMSGLSTTGIISLGLALVAGRTRLPSPATGNTALVSFAFMV